MNETLHDRIFSSLKWCYIDNNRVYKYIYLCDTNLSLIKKSGHLSISTLRLFSWAKWARKEEEEKEEEEEEEEEEKEKVKEKAF